MLIFVLQTIWLFIKELAGKDLDLIIIFKFLLYYSPKLIPLVLPLTILLASIMVFGNFAENYEFAAMKSTGISLQRAMAGLNVFIVTLGITTFFFSNNVIPWGEYESYNLRNNIRKLKPAMAIVAGQFNEVGDFNIKVSEKSGDRGQYLKDVIIHKKSGNRRGNHTTIISKTGELIGNEKSNVLQLILYDGNFYDDTPPKKFEDKEKHPLVKSSFKKYTFNVDLSDENSQDLDEKSISDKYSMLNISDLNYTIDSLKNKSITDHNNLASELSKRSNLGSTDLVIPEKKETLTTTNILDLFSAKKNMQLLDLAINTSKSAQQVITVKQNFFKGENINYNKHIIAKHEKFALGFACIILFFVGAPLGALIRKGGIGLPMVIAILLFLTYHFIGIFATNSAKDGSLNPILATWFSTIIMLPLGVFLTKRATADRGLFEFDHIVEPLKKLLKIQSRSEKEKIAPIAQINEQDIPKIKTLSKNYSFQSKTAFVVYVIALISLILFFVFKNNKLPNYATFSVQISVVSSILYLVYFLKSFISINRVYKYISEKTNNKNPLLLLLSFVFYPISYYLRRNKLNEDFLNTIK